MNLDGMEIIDISPVVHPGTAVFPGDTPFRDERILDKAKGDGYTLSKIHTTVHIGAHADAPCHYAVQGKTIDQCSLAPYLGEVQVIEIACRGRRLEVTDLPLPVKAPRVLFKTSSFPNPNQWTGDFASLSPALVEHLASRKVTLVGIDTPSIDPASDKLLESHQAVYKYSMAILEGVVLDKAAAGTYQLVALPLRLQGADASPVRAILLKEKSHGKNS